jgi:hypothetical protein
MLNKRHIFGSELFFILSSSSPSFFSMSEHKCFDKNHHQLQIVHGPYASAFNIIKTAKKYGITPKTIRSWSGTRGSLEKPHGKPKYIINLGSSINGKS